MQIPFRFEPASYSPLPPISGQGMCLTGPQQPIRTCPITGAADPYKFPVPKPWGREAPSRKSCRKNCIHFNNTLKYYALQYSLLFYEANNTRNISHLKLFNKICYLHLYHFLHIS